MAYVFYFCLEASGFWRTYVQARHIYCGLKQKQFKKWRQLTLKTGTRKQTHRYSFNILSQRWQLRGELLLECRYLLYLLFAHIHVKTISTYTLFDLLSAILDYHTVLRKDRCVFSWFSLYLLHCPFSKYEDKFYNCLRRHYSIIGSHISFKAKTQQLEVPQSQISNLIGLYQKDLPKKLQTTICITRSNYDLILHLFW